MKERLAFGRFVNEHSLQHIGFLDQKSSILVAINGVLLGLLFQFDVVKVLSSQDITYLFYMVVVLLGASAVFGLLTIIPLRRRAKMTYPNSIVFSETFYEREPDAYKEELKAIKTEKMLEEEALNAHRLANAVHYQFVMVTISIIFLMLAVGFLVVLLLIVQPYFATLPYK